MSKEEKIKEEKIKIKGDDLTRKHIYAYGIGHVQNDIVSACWFNFLSYYFVQVREIEATTAGIILLIAQLTDGISTPIVGVLSDKTNTRWGQRTPWYIIGTFMNIFGYTMIWEKCFFCPKQGDKNYNNIEFIYFIIFPPIMQIGWASVQVAHMALLPCISLNRKNKDKMCRIRTGFTFIAQLIALGISFFIFWAVTDKLLQYRILSYSVQGVGLVHTLLFLYYCREVPLSRNIDAYYENMKTNLIEAKKRDYICSEISDDDENKENLSDRDGEFRREDISSDFNRISDRTSNGVTSVDNINPNAVSPSPFNKGDKTNQNNAKVINNKTTTDDLLIKPYQKEQELTKTQEINWKYWMSKCDFYIYLVVYMFVRLSINITSTMIPFYMDLVLGYSPHKTGGTRVEISIVLVISTCGSVFNSLFLQEFVEKRISKVNARLGVMFLAFIMVSIGCIPIFFISESSKFVLFFLAFFFGTGFSLGLSSASYLINDVVGSKGNKGAFVYGAYSFSDKLSSGVVLALFLPIAKENADVLKWTMPIFPPTTIIFALLCIYFYNKTKADSEEEEEDDDELNASNILDNSKFTFNAA